MTKLRHYDNLGTARFITFSCHKRLHLLRDPDVINSILEEIDAARNIHNFALLAYVIMPNHVHLVIHPRAECKMGRVIGEIKSKAAKKIMPVFKARYPEYAEKLRIERDGEGRLVLWQRRCFDHNCRTPEDVKEKIDYCHKNPIRAGLVSDPAEYKWSSYRWYFGLETMPLRIDETKL
jgi:putative transposase